MQINKAYGSWYSLYSWLIVALTVLLLDLAKVELLPGMFILGMLILSDLLALGFVFKNWSEATIAGVWIVLNLLAVAVFVYFETFYVEVSMSAFVGVCILSLIAYYIKLEIFSRFHEIK